MKDTGYSKLGERTICIGECANGVRSVLTLPGYGLRRFGLQMQQ